MPGRPATAIAFLFAGGFHPHAGPPPRPMPALTAALSAVAVAPQLTASDPDCFHWRVTTTHAPGTHANHQQTATLCNSTGCPLVFRLAVRGHFELVAAVPSVEQDYDAFRCVVLARPVICSLLMHIPGAGCWPVQCQALSGDLMLFDQHTARCVLCAAATEACWAATACQPRP